VAAQGRGLLLSQGHREKAGWWTQRRWDDLQDRLPAWLVTRLEVFRRVLVTLTAELAVATEALAAAAPTVRPKGLGGLTYELVEREVGQWDRFDNRRQVGSYTGLCGGVSASGPSHQLLAITKHGNVRLRTALIELAWRLVLWQPDCKLVKKWWPILGNVKASKARQMAVDLWRWRTGRVQPEALGWTMIGG
jgi:transposase